LGQIKADASDDLSDGNWKGKCLPLCTIIHKKQYYFSFDDNTKGINARCNPCSSLLKIIATALSQQRERECGGSLPDK
jgi:hypothetical protein